MKKCTSCLVDKESSEFSPSTIRGKKYLQAKCKKCRSKDANGVYHKKRTKLLDINGRCAEDGCTLCGYNKDTRMLDLHHVDPVGKERKSSWTHEEASKCVWLCPNCHREVHLKITSL